MGEREIEKDKQRERERERIRCAAPDFNTMITIKHAGKNVAHKSIFTEADRQTVRQTNRHRQAARHTKRKYSNHLHKAV